MKETDLSPYLIDVYIHAQQIGDWHNSPQQTTRHLTAIETWWNRHKETGSILNTGIAYMMLAHLNMLKGYVYALDAGENWQAFNSRIFRLNAEIIEAFGHTNSLWERSVAEKEPPE